MHHGIFTYYLLEALSGAARPNEQGFITIRTVKEYVAKKVQAWVNKHRGASQTPWFQGSAAAEGIPLAVHLKKKAKRILDELLANRCVRAEGPFPFELFYEVQTALLKDAPALRIEPTLAVKILDLCQECLERCREGDVSGMNRVTERLKALLLCPVHGCPNRGRTYHRVVEIRNLGRGTVQIDLGHHDEDIKRFSTLSGEKKVVTWVACGKRFIRASRKGVREISVEKLLAVERSAGHLQVEIVDKPSFMIVLPGAPSPPIPGKEEPPPSPREKKEPDAHASHMVSVLLDRDYVVPGKSTELTLVFVIGREALKAKGFININEVVERQSMRLEEFARRLEEEGRRPSPRLLKQLDLWSRCACSSQYRCQGGAEPCIECNTCALHPEMMGSMRGMMMPMKTDMMNMERGRMECPSKNVCFVVDTSTSMRGRRLEFVKEALKEALRHVMKTRFGNDVYSLVSFNSKVTVPVEPVVVDTMTPGLMMSKTPVEEFVRDKNGPHAELLKGIIHKIDGLKAMGKTNIYQALEKAGKLIKKLPAQRSMLLDPGCLNRIVLLTDGKQTVRVGTRPRVSTLQGLLSGWMRTSDSLAKEFHAPARRICGEGAVSISAIGVGEDFDEQVLGSLVKADLGHAGNYYYLSDPSQVHDIFWRDVMFSPYAKDAKAWITFEPGVRLVANLSRDIFERPERGNEWIANLRSLSHENKRTLVMRIRVPGNILKQGSSRVRLGMVRMEAYSFRERRRISDEVSIEVRVSPQAARLASSRSNWRAKEELIIALARRAFEKAYLEAARRNSHSAKAILLRAANEVRRYRARER